jgi:hypothetical protein
MINPLSVWTRYNLAFGYFITVVIIVTFIWLFAEVLLRAPEFYSGWDARNFYGLAKGAQSKVQSILAGEPNSWSLSGWGFAHQYNMLFALPLAPVLVAFGDSLYIYGMAVALIYGTAATLAVGAIAAFLLAGYRPSIVLLTFASTAFVAVTRSAGWYSTIWYYPDIGDAFVLAIWLIGALLLLRRPNWQRTGVLVLLTVAVLLFRRANLFAWGDVGIGLAISAAIECWADWRKSELPEKQTRLRAGALRIGYLAASALIALGILAIPPRSFVREMLSIAANDAYVDYAEEPTKIIVVLLGVMGIIPIALSAAGYIAGAIVFRRRRFEIIGLGLGAILNIITWVAVIRYVAPSNYIVPGVLFLPLGIGLGLGALAEKLRGRKLVAALGTAFLLLFLSAGPLVDGAVSKIMDISDLSADASCVIGSASTCSSLHFLQGRVTKLSLHQGMEGPFKELFARLGIAGPQPRKVLVVASSIAFNEAVVTSAAEALLGDKAKSYFFHSVPVLDSRDGLLVTEIIDADFVLMGNPLQTHLERGFKGLQAVRDMFLDHDDAARDFERLGEPVAFPGFSTLIYRRIRESDERTALATIDALKSVVPLQGYRQPSWIEIGRPRRSEAVDGRKDAVVARNRIAGDGWPARYVSYDTMPVAAAELRGVGETTCPQGALLTLRVMTRGDAEPKAVATTLLTQRAAPQPFSLAAVMPVSGLHLELEINPPLSDAACDVTLEHLQLHSTQSGS